MTGRGRSSVSCDSRLLFTIGHSTRPQTDFLDILRSFDVTILADIRTVPRSRANPQYNQVEFREWLLANKVEYVHLPDLGGLRHARRDSVNTGWRNQSFRGFADYMQSAQFEAALETLLSLGAKQAAAIACAEAVPWRCHRSLVADALLVRGVEVRHIMGVASARPHVLTPWAKVEGLRITYPPSGTG